MLLLKILKWELFRASKARAVTVKFGTQNISTNIHIDYSVENHQDLDKLLSKILEV